MSDVESEKNGGFKRILRTGAILMILVLFPLISWLYLKSGIAFRKDALASLVVKSEFVLSEFELADQSVLNLESEKKRVFTLFILEQEDQFDIAALVGYEKQFRATDDVTVLFINRTGIPSTFPAESKILLMDDGAALNKELLVLIRELQTEVNVLLFDGAGSLRNFYDINDFDQLKDLITHTAVLLPPTDSRKNVRIRKPLEL